MQKAENDYIEPKLQTVIEFEDESDQDKKHYLQRAIDFNKVDLTTAWEGTKMLFPQTLTLNLKLIKSLMLKLLIYMSGIEITDERPLHPREWLKRKFNQKSGDKKFLRKVPQHSRNRLKWKMKNRENIQNEFSAIEDKDLKFIKQVPQHPQDTLAQKTKYNNLAIFIKQVLQHPRDRLTQKTKKNDDVIFVKQVPKQPPDRLVQKTKDNDEVIFVKQAPQHPRNRLKWKIKKYAKIEYKKKEVVTSKAKDTKTV